MADQKFSLQGKVHLIGEEQAVSTIKKQALVLEFTSGNYKEYPSFEFINDRMNQLVTLSVGDEVTVHFDVAGRSYTNKSTGETQFFTSLKGWKVDQIASGHSAAAPQPPKPAAPSAPSAPAKDDSDDLPF